MNDSNEKRSIEWFENRVGLPIYRAPFFAHEKGRGPIGMKIKDKNHAKVLFDLQRAGRPQYQDKPEHTDGNWMEDPNLRKAVINYLKP